MNLLKKLVLNNMNEFKESFMSYKLTYILTIVVTMALTICYDNEFIIDNTCEDIFMHIVIFYVCSGCLIWFSEILFKKLLFKIGGYIIGIVLGIVFSYLFLEYDGYEIYRITIGYVIIVMCIAIYLIIRNLKVKFTKYILDLFQNIFNYTIMYIVINIGITFLVYIFDALILEDSFSFFIVRFQIILFGLFYVTSIILSFTKKTVHISVFVTNMIKYILYPITLIAMIIVYSYLIKIIVTINMPSNAVYNIVASIFAGGFPTMLMLANYKQEKTFFNKSLIVVSYLFIPLIILQIFSLSIRCNTYGMTSTRYMGILIILVEICAIGMYLYKKKDILDKILIVCAILTFIATMTPINMETVSINNQTKRLKEAWPQNKEYEELSEENKEKAAGAYNYLVYQLDKNVDEYIPSYLSKEDIEKIATPYTYYVHQDEYDEKYISVIVPKENLKYNIEQYKEIKIIEGYAGDDYKDKMTKLDKKVESSITEIMEKYGDEEEEVEDFFYNNKQLIQISKNEDVIILELNGSYGKNEDELSILNMSYQIIVLRK